MLTAIGSLVESTSEKITVTKERTTWKDQNKRRRKISDLRKYGAKDFNREVLKLLQNSFLKILPYNEYCEFMTLVSKDRIKDLHPKVKLEILFVIPSKQTEKVTYEAMYRIFLSTRGHDLTMIKRKIDNRKDGKSYNLAAMVKTLIDAGCGRNLMSHIRAEGRAVLRDDRKSTEPLFKVLCDIDDTCFPRHNDKSYPKGQPYPGHRSLIRALCKNGDLAFLTARPSLWNYFEDYTHTVLSTKGFGNFTLIIGDVTNWMVPSSKLGARKLAKLKTYLKLWPECEGIIFIGDSGEGDVIFGENLLKEMPEMVRLIIINDVHDKDGRAKTSARERQAQRKKGIYYVDCYIEAALIAFQKKVISENALKDVCKATLAGFKLVQFDSKKQKNDAASRINRALQTVRKTTLANKPKRPRPAQISMKQNNSKSKGGRKKSGSGAVIMHPATSTFNSGRPQASQLDQMYEQGLALRSRGQSAPDHRYMQPSINLNHTSAPGPFWQNDLDQQPIRTYSQPSENPNQHFYPMHNSMMMASSYPHQYGHPSEMAPKLSQSGRRSRTRMYENERQSPRNRFMDLNFHNSAKCPSGPSLGSSETQSRHIPSGASQIQGITRDMNMSHPNGQPVGQQHDFKTSNSKFFEQLRDDFIPN